MRVIVVGFAPAEERATVGGFDWFPWSADGFDEAEAKMRTHLADAAATDPGLHSYTFVPLRVPDEVAYAQPGGAGTGLEVNRDAVTSWIDANLHLVEVGLEQASPSPEYAPLCIVYGCGEPADDGGPIEFALPGGGTAEARVCPGHRESLAANTLRGVSLTTAPGEPLSEAAREAVDRLLDAPRQTRPSAILRRPDPETPVSELTTAELLREALDRTEARRLAAAITPTSELAAREGRVPILGYERDLDRAGDAIQDAISLHNRAVYRERGIFAITDAERTPGGED